MNPNLTVGYMTEQIARERLDGVAARGWLAEEAAATSTRARRRARLLAGVNALFGLLGERIGRSMRPASTFKTVVANATRG
jgi:hypothetical protein